MSARQSRKHFRRKEKIGLLSHRAEQITKHQPAGTRFPGSLARLREALHSPPKVGDGAFFLGEVRNRKHDRCFAGDLRQNRAYYDYVARTCDRCRVDAGEILSRDYEHVTLRQVPEQIAGSFETESLGAVNVGGPVAPQCEIINASQRSFFTFSHSERTLSALHQLGQQKKRLIREHWRGGYENRLASQNPRCHGNRMLPGCRRQLAAAVAHPRLIDTIFLVHPPVVETSPVAHEESVYFFIWPRAHPHELIFARLHDDVATLRAIRTDRRCA